MIHINNIISKVNEKNSHVDVSNIKMNREFHKCLEHIIFLFIGNRTLEQMHFAGKVSSKLILEF